MTCTVMQLLPAILLIHYGYVKKSRDCSSDTLNSRTSNLRWLDVDAFRNLVHPGEEEFLRNRLQPADFGAIQQERLAAALDYTAIAAHQVAILARMSEGSRASGDPVVKHIANKLVHEAARLRTYAFLAMLLPGARNSLVRVAEAYEQVIQQASLLGLPHSIDS